MLREGPDHSSRRIRTRVLPCAGQGDATWRGSALGIQPRFRKQREKRGEEAWSPPLSCSGRRGVVGAQDTGASGLRRTWVLGDVSCLVPSVLAFAAPDFSIAPLMASLSSDDILPELFVK